MLKSKLPPLYQKTATDLNYPLALVEAVILHEFATIKEQVMSPSPLVMGIRMEDLGKFYWKWDYYMAGFRTLRNPYRKGRINIEILQKYISLRPYVSAFAINRKFKRRFGTWHWKGAHE